MNADPHEPAWTEGEVQDLISDALSDSLDADWTPGTGARYVVTALAKEGLLTLSTLSSPSTGERAEAQGELPTSASAHEGLARIRQLQAYDHTQHPYRRGPRSADIDILLGEIDRLRAAAPTVTLEGAHQHGPDHTDPPCDARCSAENGRDVPGQAQAAEGPCQDSAGHAPTVTPAQGEELARRFHETYERLAPLFGYETRKESAKPWSEVPDQNKRLMIAVCNELAPSTTPAAGALTAAQVQREALPVWTKRIAEVYRGYVSTTVVAQEVVDALALASTTAAGGAGELRGGGNYEGEKCFVCDERFHPGDRVLDDMSGETGHLDCFGPERDGYVKDLETGEPLGPDDDLPKGYVWGITPAPSPSDAPADVEGLRRAAIEVLGAAEYEDGLFVAINTPAMFDALQMLRAALTEEQVFASEFGPPRVLRLIAQARRASQPAQHEAEVALWNSAWLAVGYLGALDESSASSLAEILRAALQPQQGGDHD